MAFLLHLHLDALSIYGVVHEWELGNREAVLWIVQSHEILHVGRHSFEVLGMNGLPLDGVVESAVVREIEHNVDITDVRFE